MLLEKILQSQGFGSRKFCQQLIQQGHVYVQDKLYTNPKAQFPVDDLMFTVYGEKYRYREHVYVLMNKPKNYECSHQPTHHHSVFSLLPEILIHRGIQCVGRLDQDTTGLLLFTDDGKYLQSLTHPKKHVAKVYEVTTVDEITSQQIEMLRHGVELRHEKGIFAASEITLLDTCKLNMTIHQGIYHQVKRMIAAVGNKVTQLHRKQIGQFVLPDIDEGEWQFMTNEQKMLSQQTILRSNDEFEIHYP